MGLIQTQSHKTIADVGSHLAFYQKIQKRALSDRSGCGYNFQRVTDDALKFSYPGYFAYTGCLGSTICGGQFYYPGVD